jgi:hypothetical protein
MFTAAALFAFAMLEAAEKPRVLLIGDSISIGYTKPVQEILGDKAEVVHHTGNAGPASNGVFLIDTWLGKGRWDVIHFNFGLHDLKLMEDGQAQAPPAVYARNLRLIVSRLKKTGAKLIFATTTPVPEGKVSPPRRPADVVEYNRIALDVMKEHGVGINDLYGFALPRLTKIQLPVNVHYTEEGYAALGEAVGAAISAQLE